MQQQSLVEDLALANENRKREWDSICRTIGKDPSAANPVELQEHPPNVALAAMTLQSNETRTTSDEPDLARSGGASDAKDLITSSTTTSPEPKELVAVLQEYTKLHSGLLHEVRSWHYNLEQHSRTRFEAHMNFAHDVEVRHARDAYSSRTQIVEEEQEIENEDAEAGNSGIVEEEAEEMAEWEAEEQEEEMAPGADEVGHNQMYRDHNEMIRIDQYDPAYRQRNYPEGSILVGAAPKAEHEHTPREDPNDFRTWLLQEEKRKRSAKLSQVEHNTPSSPPTIGHEDLGAHKPAIIQIENPAVAALLGAWTTLEIRSP